jgi:transcriptional regulator with XRE-family HTH domain
MNEDLSGCLRKLMTERRISQTALSRATGVPQPTINRILNGVSLNPRHDSIVHLATFFHVTPDSMYGSPSDEASLDELCEKIRCLSSTERSILLVKIANNSLTKNTAQLFPL